MKDIQTVGNAGGKDVDMRRDIVWLGLNADGERRTGRGEKTCGMYGRRSPKKNAARIR